jgi:hypothetical protein
VANAKEWGSETRLKIASTLSRKLGNHRLCMGLADPGDRVAGVNVQVES